MSIFFFFIWVVRFIQPPRSEIGSLLKSNKLTQQHSFLSLGWSAPLIFHFTQVPWQTSQSNLTSTSHRLPPRPSHLVRAQSLVEHHTRLVLEAQSKIGTAQISLTEACEGLAEAEKVRDHLVTLAREGCRPVWHAWLDESGEEDLNQASRSHHSHSDLMPMGS